MAEWYEREYVKNSEAVSRLTGEQLIRVVNFRGLFQRPSSRSSRPGGFTLFIIEASFPLICGRWEAKCRQSTKKVTTPPKPGKLQRSKPNCDSKDLIGPANMPLTIAKWVGGTMCQAATQQRV